MATEGDEASAAEVVLLEPQPVQVVRAGFKLASGDPEPTLPPPALGQHSAEILASLGYLDEEIARLLETGAAAAPGLTSK